MKVREQVLLSSLTTLRVGREARFVIDVERVDELQDALLFATQRKLPWYVLGEGSNVLAPDTGYDGVIIRPRFGELVLESEEAVVGAGVAWDTLVRAVASKELWGMENLAGIPGTSGAAPIQNIGAYGMEVGDTISFVKVLSSTNGETYTFTKKECNFSYRDSRFKQDPTLIVTAVGFTFSKNPAPRLSYADLARVKDEGGDLSSPSAIGDAVRRVRARKFPDLKMSGTAGSFFKNPVIPEDLLATLRNTYPDLPGYEAEGGVKIPLAFVLDRMLSLRGFRMGKARLFETQPLVLVVDDQGTASDVEALAHYVSNTVKEKTGIVIEREVQSLKTK
jgi:UDP-N-acetylmuramate dehydrogenase